MARPKPVQPAQHGDIIFLRNKYNKHRTALMYVHTNITRTRFSFVHVGGSDAGPFSGALTCGDDNDKIFVYTNTWTAATWKKDDMTRFLQQHYDLKFGTSLPAALGDVMRTAFPGDLPMTAAAGV
jgi:hypothetical protein